MPIMNRFAEIETCVEVCAIVILDICYCWSESSGLIHCVSNKEPAFNSLLT